MEILKAGFLLACVVGSLGAPLETGSRQCSQQTCNVENSRYEVGQTYTYDYSALTSTWINGTSDDKSTLNFLGRVQIDVIAPCELVLKFTKFTFDETDINGDAAPSLNENSMRNDIQRYNLRFALNDGVITDVCPSAGEKTWALNFKRGFLSTIQSSVMEVPVGEYWVVTEIDVTGKCPVIVSQGEAPGSIEKTKDFMKCEQRNKLEGSIKATMLHPQAPLSHILKCDQECLVFFESNIVSSAVCEEKHHSKPFSGPGSGAMTYSKATLGNLRQTPAASTPENSIIERRTTILFDHDESTSETEAVVLGKARTLLEAINLQQDTGVSPNLFSDLVTEMRKVQTTDGMMELKGLVSYDDTLFNIFKDALPSVQTTPSVETMVTIINDVASSSNDEMKRAFVMTRALWLTSPATFQHPKKEMISAYLPLIRSLSDKDSVFFLPISSMIHQYCTSEDSSCLERREVLSAIDYFQSLLGYDCSPTTEIPAIKMLMALKALTNIRQLSSDSTIAIINNCFSMESSTKTAEIRVAALELVRRLPCKPTYRTAALSMYANQNLDSELRIVGYRAVMECANEDIMEEIREIMTEEGSNQVGSYVWSHLTNLNETKDPQKQHIKSLVQRSGVFQAFRDMDRRKFSRNVELSWYSDDIGNGFTFDSDMIFSEESFLPRQIRANATVELYGYVVNLLEIGGRLEGLHHLLESIFGPRGYFKKHSVQDLVQEYREQQQEAVLGAADEIDPNELPEGLPEGLTASMYSQLLRMLQFQRKIFGGKVSLPSPGDTMPRGMPEGMTQRMYDQLLLRFHREGLPGERSKRHLIKDSGINDVEAEYPFHEENDPMASVYMKMYGNELGYINLQKIKTRLTEMKTNINPMKVLIDLTEESTHQLSKNAVFLDVSWTMPTLIGLPLKIAVNGTITASVRTQGTVDLRGMLMAPRGFIIDGVIEPSVAVELSTSMEVAAADTRCGLNHVAQIHSSVALGGRVKITSGKEVSFQLNVPDRKQKIVDMSSTIYLRHQNQAVVVEGIPERLDLTYCSGSVATKHLGIQVCTQVAFPKANVKESYPLYPLTGSSHMTFTLEKTDPSLTSWNLEGSYELQKEMVEDVQTSTDKFHFMVGAPDTDIPRLFQADVSYDRNDMVMDLNVITPTKTFDLTTRAVNDPTLRKLEVSLTLDKTRVYTIDSEVATEPSVVDGDIVLNFYPRLDVTTPTGNLMKYRGALNFRDGQQSQVDMWMSLDTPKTALVTLRGDIVKTESTKKLRYSSDLQITGRYLNVNVTSSWQKQKRDDVVSIDVEIVRAIGGVPTKEIAINAKYSNRTTEGQKEWDFKTEWVFARYPLLSFLLESDYTGREGHSESATKLCYRYNGQECSQDTKIIMGHLLTSEITDDHFNESLSWRLRNPANNINIELQQHAVRNATHPFDISMAIVNNTSEVEIIGVGFHERILSTTDPVRGDLGFEVRSRNWRYAVHQDWEFSGDGRLVSNAAVNWGGEQEATLMLSFIPTTDEATGRKGRNLDVLLTYSLGSLSANWFTSTLNKDVSHGASLIYNDLSLVAYKIDFLDHGLGEGSPDTSLTASFNVSRPASPISLVLHASNVLRDIEGGLNIAVGDVKVLTSDVSFSSTTGEDSRPKVNWRTSFDVVIPLKDLSFGASWFYDVIGLKQEQEVMLRYNGEQIYYTHSLSETFMSEDYRYQGFKYESHQSTKYPLPDYATELNMNVDANSVDYRYIIHLNQKPVLVLGLSWDGGMVAVDELETIKEGKEDFYRHDLKLAVQTPLVIMRDVSWNTTLDVNDVSVILDSRLLYFPDQERPYRFAVDYQNKSSELVTHLQLTTDFEMIKRSIRLFTMVKFDLGVGTIKGSSSVEFAGIGSAANKFEVIADCTNDTASDVKTRTAVLTFNSPENSIVTEAMLSYKAQTVVRATLSMAISEEAIFGLSSVFRNESTTDSLGYSATTTLAVHENQYRVEMLHVQEDASVQSEVDVYRNSEPKPFAGGEVTYNLIEDFSDLHTVVVSFYSETIDPVSITTILDSQQNSQTFNVLLEMYDDNNVDVSFSVVRSESEGSRVKDVSFDVVNTFVPDWKIQVTGRQEMNDKTGYRLNSDLRVADSHVLAFTAIGTAATDMYSYITMSSCIQLTFPQLAEDPIFSNLAMRTNTEIAFGSSNMKNSNSYELTFLWGQLTDEETVSLNVTKTGEQLTVLFAQPKTFSVILQNNSIPTAKRSFEIQLNGEEENLMRLVGSYALIDASENNKRAMLTFSRRNRSDISATLDAQYMDEDTVLRTNLKMKYSEDEERTIEFLLELLNKTNAVDSGYDLNVAVKHPVIGVDVSAAMNVLNDESVLSAGIESQIILDGSPEPFNFEVSWDKNEKVCTFTSQTPFRKIASISHFEDRSYSDYRIYRVTDFLTFDDTNEIRKVFEYNEQLQEISFEQRDNPDNAEDYWRIKVGYLNESAAVVVIDAEIDGAYYTDMKETIVLTSPTTLLSHLQWSTEWMDSMSVKAEEKYAKMQENLESRGAMFAEAMEKLALRVEEARNDLLASNEDMWESWVNCKERVAVRIEEKMASAAVYREAWVAKRAADWTAFKEEMLQRDVDVDAMLVKFEEKYTTWADNFNQTSQKYLKITADRVKTFYDNNVDPMFEEFKAVFEKLMEQHRLQLDLLYPDISVEEFNPKYASTKLVEDQGFDVEIPEDEQESGVVINSIVVEGQEVSGNTMMWGFAESVGEMEIVTDFRRFYNATKVEFESLLAELGGDFKSSNIYADFDEWWEYYSLNFPGAQWREDIRNRLTEYQSSQEWQDLVDVIEDLRMELNASVGPLRTRFEHLRSVLSKAFGDYRLNLGQYFRVPSYEVLRNDPDHGDIRVLLHLPFQMDSLQSLPRFLRKIRALSRLRDLIAEVREKTGEALGEVTMDGGRVRSMHELMLRQPFLTYRQGNFTQWFQGEKIKAMRCFWKAVHAARLYLNPVHWVPPQDANAMIVGSNHYVTFDRTFYDFSQDCSYILAHDFDDGNFTVVVEYSRDGITSPHGRSKNIVIFLNETEILEIQSDFTILHGKQPMELPFQLGSTTATRTAHTLRVHNTNGVTVECDTAHDVCSLDLSGWYFGKTAGLLGTYNYDPSDDMTKADGTRARHLDDLMRSWKVGRQCEGSVPDPIVECNTDPDTEANRICAAQFLDETSDLTQCLRVVDPAPYYAMCTSKMCQLAEEDRSKSACAAIKAYVKECNRLTVGITVPAACVVCDAPTGKFNQGESKYLLDNNGETPHSADVVVIVEQKPCNAHLMEHVGAIVDMLDTELKNEREYFDNRFGLLGFGGEGIFDLPNIHTIGGAVFNDKRSFGFQGVPALQFGSGGNNNTFDAILAAAKYPFRAGVAKNIILVSCSGCEYLNNLPTSYAEVSSVLLSQGIQFNILMDVDLQLVPSASKRSSLKYQDIYGMDNRTVFTNKALSTGRLIGDKSLRRLVAEPVNQCVLLAYETNGALFDSSQLGDKKFMDVLTQRLLKHTKVEPCQLCKCEADCQGVGRSVCRSCEVADDWISALERKFATARYFARIGVSKMMQELGLTEEEAIEILHLNDTPTSNP